MKVITVVSENHKKGRFLLISLIIHTAAFILLGMIVIRSAPEPRESISVQLIKATKEVRRLRRNIPTFRSHVIMPANSPDKSQDMVKPVVNQGNISYQAVVESVSVFGFEPVKRQEAKANPRIAPPSKPLAAPKIAASNPVARSPEESIFDLHDKLPKLAPSHNSASLPVYSPSDPTILRDFLQVVSRRIAKSKRYPKWAMDAGLEGKVVVRFTILRDGSLGEAFLLVKSSGTEILDNAAVAAIKKAAPFPSLPTTLRREQLQIELPMYFQMVES